MSQLLNRTFPVFEFYCSQKLNIDLGQAFGISKTILNTFLALQKKFSNFALFLQLTASSFSNLYHIFFFFAKYHKKSWEQFNKKNCLGTFLASKEKN